MPSPGSAHAAGLDIAAAVDGPVTLAPGEIRLIPAGFYMALPPGWEAQVRPRSGLALKHGVTCVNSPGTIDADYRGEVCVILGNVGRETFVVKRGLRIAQMVIAAVTRAAVVEVEMLSETARGDGGFGHTGM